MIPSKSSPRLCPRPRSDSDDERVVRKLPVKKELTIKDNVEKILFPVAPNVPIVYWNRPSNSKDVYSKDDLMKYVRWPIKTEIVCFQCCHPFDGVPVPLPDTYDTRRKVYKCKGNFCSWQCSKSYNLNQTKNFGKGDRNMYISLLAHQTWIKYRNNTKHFENMKTYCTYNINPAPSRELLIMFGGSMGIEEYRKGFYGIIPPEEALEDKPFITFSNRLLLPFTSTGSAGSTVSTEVIEPSNPIGISITKQIDTSNAHIHSNNFCNALNKAKTDKVVMKRKRDVSSKNTLMSTMGVVIETKKR